MRFATINGLWNGSETTPVPSLICLVFSAAAAIMSSGEPISSQPVEWCSPNHASVKPSPSRCATS